MSSVVAIVKSIVGQVFVVSPEGVRRVLVEGDRLYVGDQIDTGLSGAVSLELADGRTLDLGRDTQWSANAPDSSTDLSEATAQAAPSVEELQQAIAAGVDPTTALEATAAGPSAAGTGGAAGGGHSFVMLDATAGRVDPTIGFPTAGINSAGQAAQNITGGQNTDTTTNALRDSTLSLSATPTITEAGGVLVYTATLTQAPLTDLTITLSNGSVIVIPAGSTTGTVNVPLAPNDSVYNDPTQIDVTVTGTTGHDSGYRHNRHHHRHSDGGAECHRRWPDHLHCDPDQPGANAGHRHPVQRLDHHHRRGSDHRHRQRADPGQ